MAKVNLIAQHSGHSVVVDVTAGFASKEAVPAGVGITEQKQGLEFGGLSAALFRLEDLGDGSYRIVSEYSDMVFDVAGASLALGAPIILWPWHGGRNQRFRVIAAPQFNIQSWGHSLEAVHSGMVLDMAGGPFPAPSQLVQWSYHGGPNQRFRAFGAPIKPLHSDLVLDVAGAALGRGAPIIQFPFNGEVNQLFQVEYIVDPVLEAEGLGSFSYRVVALQSGKVWDIEGASLENGARLIQWDWHGGLNQQFKIFQDPSVDGYSFMARHSGKVIDVAGASLAPSQLIQWDNHFGSNQRFKL